MEQKEKIYRDFLLVVLGQIISLFGNSVVRFALPLHLLERTGSPALLGVVSGFAFLPLAVTAPVGGMIADRVNKRNIMVALDFLTAGISVLFIALYARADLVTLILIMLFLLYGISGAYQPTVQASIPLLVPVEKVLPANAVINMISSLSGLLGPALGGIAYHLWGILPVIGVCAGCFLFSAVMEIFIRIPFEKRPRTVSIIRAAWGDLKDSLAFIGREKREIGKLTVSCACVNLFLSALLIIGLPVVVMQVLVFPGDSASQMYGFLQAILAVGGLAGGLAAGVMGRKAGTGGSWLLILAAGVCLIPIGLVLSVDCNVYLAYAVMAVSGFCIMACASVFTIQAVSHIQIVTPSELIGKVISWVVAISTCAQPLGQILYGYLFDRMAGREYAIFYGAFVLTALVAWYGRKIKIGG